MKFYYGQKVKVIGGFYRTTTGTIYNTRLIKTFLGKNYRTYVIRVISTEDKEGFDFQAYEEDLESEK